MRWFLIVFMVVELVMAGYVLVRRPFNVAGIVGALTAFFGLLPVILLLGDGQSPSYSWRAFSSLDLTTSTALDAAVLLAVTNLFLLVGALVAQQAPAEEVVITGPWSTKAALRTRFTAIRTAYVVVWVLAFVAIYRGSGRSLVQFFQPVKQTGITAEQSGYARSLFMMTPVVLFTLSFWQHGRLRLRTMGWLLMALVATFSTHQRRELVTTVVYVLALLYLFGLNPAAAPRVRLSVAKLRAMGRRARRRRRTVSLASLGGALLLVPALWYTRVYFTAMSRGNEVDPLGVRSPWEVLFGSPATGYPVLVQIQDFTSRTSLQPLYLASAPLLVLIPRSLWPGKPVDLDTTLQDYYAIAENPSSFWFGELVYSFGLLAPLAAVLLGYVLSRVSSRADGSPSYYVRTVGAVLAMQSITLFKNGILQFSIRVAIMLLLLAVARRVLATRRVPASRQLVASSA